MKLNKKYSALFCIILSVSIMTFAMDWPSRDGVLISNFGSNDRGTAVQFSSFRTEGPIYPAEVGELVFYQDPSNSASRFPSPLGSWMALDHGDNLIGIYSCYKDSDSPSITIAEKNTIIAASGRSGWSNEDGFSFAFFDRKERRWINPSILITPLEDTRPPVIRSVELRSASGAMVNPTNVRTIAQGTYTIYVDTYDTIAPTGEILAPNRIICTLNGAEEKELKFEFLIAKNGKRMANRDGLVSTETIYRSYPGFELGEIRFSRGQATLVVEARDIAENSRSLTYRLAIE